MLRARGIERDTIVIFMGDNGTAVGTSGKRDDGYNAGMRGKKGSVYEGGHRGKPVGFRIGFSEENPTLFTVRDGHPTDGRVIWQPVQLADDRLFINGWWDIEVVRAGR